VHRRCSSPRGLQAPGTSARGHRKKRSVTGPTVTRFAIKQGTKFLARVDQLVHTHEQPAERAVHSSRTRVGERQGSKARKRGGQGLDMFVWPARMPTDADQPSQHRRVHKTILDRAKGLEVAVVTIARKALFGGHMHRLKGRDRSRKVPGVSALAAKSPLRAPSRAKSPLTFVFRTHEAERPADRGAS